MSADGVNKERRRFLVATTSAVGAVGAGLAAVPFISSWKPSAKAQAVGAPVQVNIAKLGEGQLLKVQWRGQTIGVLRRSKANLDDLPQVDAKLRDPMSEDSIQPEYITGEPRALRPEFLVVNMHCTHLGCVPTLVPQVGPQPFEADWKGGFYCPCHKSKFDMAGRVYQGVPAPTNLTIPPYSFADDNTIIIGVNPEGAA
ncbi:ubiquinol-cytochrome c reductase iron-sulfur subunit [Marinihelvus fidelis]|uniref:Ubiquinol-cytochrome c reductase iron-sulfur subunit n=1 Tax=Marinihelvus fidelis TaxID=2613842 RepID=A0A5N0TGT5_9GAMM|nr:ubiquinol-cytochrome c reductase iron-sulfur subunit [Marinihelvus fidelis]KAA9132489.1 ubiquinol-cytochrome c reductase iron-sulfur subunit [Marinihelvus fidelis]